MNITGDTDIYNLIINDATITVELDDFGGNPAVFNDILVPSTFKGKASINLYPINSIAGGIEYTRVNYSVNCRANDYPSCKSIANNVVDLLNRYNQSGYFLVANIQAVIRPENELDTYNIPIEVIYRSK